MSSHPELQSAFRAGLASGVPPRDADAISGDIARRFGVYRNNVTLGLIEALRARFPVAEALVGEAFFRAAARVYIAENKPKSPVLLLWGATFPAFLARFPPAASVPYLADVARLEHARGVAYHAADAAPLEGAALARAASGVALHPSVQLLRARHAFVTIWSAHQPGAQLPEIDAMRPEIALVLRNRRLDVEVWSLSQADSLFVDCLRRTGALIGAVGAARALEPQYDPAPLILRLATAGAFISREETDA